MKLIVHADETAPLYGVTFSSVASAQEFGKNLAYPASVINSNGKIVSLLFNF